MLGFLIINKVSSLLCSATWPGYELRGIPEPETIKYVLSKILSNDKALLLDA